MRYSCTPEIKWNLLKMNRHEIVLKPVTKRAADVAGLLSRYKKKLPFSIEEMNRAIADQVQKENR